MNIENEIKVIGIDEKKVETLLIKKGYKKHKLIKYRRCIFDTPSGDIGTWIRLRTDGNESTLAYKKVHRDAIDGVEEHEVVVSDFDKTKDLLLASGLNFVSYQENTRRLFTKGKVEVSIDSWPLIPPYLEIEGPNLVAVKATLVELGLENFKTTSLPTTDVYRLFDIDIERYSELKF